MTLDEPIRSQLGVAQRRSVAFAGLLLFLGPAAENAPNWALLRADQPPGSGSALIIDRTEIDLGTFWIGSTPQSVIRVANPGRTPIEILRVTPSCECVTILSSPNLVRPEQPAQISFALDSYSLHGPFSETITLQTSEPGRPSQVFRLRGICNWYVEPSAMFIRIDRVPYGQAAERTIVLTNRSPGKLDLALSAGRQDGAFRAYLEKTRPGQEFALRVRLEPSVAEGVHREVIDLRTNLEKQPLLSIPVEADVVADVEIIPPVVYLPDGSPRGLVMAQPLIRIIDVINHGQREVKLSSANCSIANLRVRLSPVQAGKAYRLMLQGPTAFRIGPDGGIINITTDDPDRQVIQVALRPAAMEGQAAATANTAKSPTRPALAMMGKPAPAFELRISNGRVVLRADLAAHPATVLNFISSTCPFCRKQAPMLEAVRSRYEPRGVRFVNLGQNRGDQVATLEETTSVLASLGWQGEVAMDPGNQVGRRFRVTSFPTLFVVGKDGEIAEVVIGAKADLAARLDGALERLLAGEAQSKAASRPASSGKP